MRLTTLDQDIDAGRKYLNERSLQIGHLLPLSEESFKEYFPEKNSFLLYSVRAIDAIFSYIPGREKWTPKVDYFVATDSPAGLKEAVGRIEDTAVAQEKIILTTRIFGYDRKRLQALKALGYKVGASIPEAASLDGKRFDLHYLYKEISNRYSHNIHRSYAKPGLYPVQSVDKAKNQRLKIRGYRKEDRSFLDKAATHLNVIRGIANGLYEGSVPWSPGTYENWFDKRRVYPIVCEDESIGEPVGLLDLFRIDADVMQHVMSLGMYVRAEYHGLGVGTALMDAMKVLAKRLNVSRIILTVFEGNTPAERLYAKVGFIECGKLPGWLQEGYINEKYMVLQLD